MLGHNSSAQVVQQRHDANADLAQQYQHFPGLGRMHLQRDRSALDYQALGQQQGQLPQPLGQLPQPTGQMQQPEGQQLGGQVQQHQQSGLGLLQQPSGKLGQLRRRQRPTVEDTLVQMPGLSEPQRVGSLQQASRRVSKLQSAASGDIAAALVADFILTKSESLLICSFQGTACFCHIK